MVHRRHFCDLSSVLGLGGLKERFPTNFSINFWFMSFLKTHAPFSESNQRIYFYLLVSVISPSTDYNFGAFGHVFHLGLWNILQHKWLIHYRWISVLCSHCPAPRSPAVAAFWVEQILSNSRWQCCTWAPLHINTCPFLANISELRREKCTEYNNRKENKLGGKRVKRLDMFCEFECKERGTMLSRGWQFCNLWRVLQTGCVHSLQWKEEA